MTAPSLLVATGSVAYRLRDLDGEAPVADARFYAPKVGQLGRAHRAASLPGDFEPCSGYRAALRDGRAPQPDLAPWSTFPPRGA